MPPIAYEFDWPDRLVVGTVGRPGSRSFYLQARTGSRMVSVALEKEQSAVLAVKIEEILDELMVERGNPYSIPATTPVELVDNDPLDQPVDAHFRTGALSLGWDPATAQIVVEAFPFVEEEDDEALDEDMPEPEEVFVVRIPVGTARAFAKRTLEVVGAGRPLCPLCGTPIEGGGHICPLPDDL
jgi:uncharacterized repeat protein (TIGR03847 family)